MAFPTYINKGTFQSTTAAGGTTPSLPASIQTGDLLIAVVSTPNDSTVYSVDGDWTLLANIGTGTDGTAGAIDVWVWYAKYNGVALGAFGTTSLKLKCQQVYAFRNAAVPTVTATAVQATAATAWTLPAITTTRADSFVFFAIGNDRDLASTTNVSGYTNANLASITEIHDETVATGVGGGIATIYAQKATTGSTGTTSATSAASNTAAFVTFAISTPLSVTADPGAYTYTGTAANTLFNRKVVADPGTYTYTGTDANTLYKRIITADPGTYSYTGTNANTLYNRIVTADPGTYTYTGTAANTLFNRIVTADPGTYSYTGTDATLTYATVGAYTLIAGSGTYSYTGTDANTLYNRVVIAGAGTYSYSGTNANTLYNRVVTAGAGTYSYTGTDATFTYVQGKPIYIGVLRVKQVYLGTTQVNKTYLGTTKIF